MSSDGSISWTQSADIVAVRKMKDDAGGVGVIRTDQQTVCADMSLYASRPHAEFRSVRNIVKKKIVSGISSGSQSRSGMAYGRIPNPH